VASLTRRFHSVDDVHAVVFRQAMNSDVDCSLDAGDRLACHPNGAVIILGNMHPTSPVEHRPLACCVRGVKTLRREQPPGE
jgi:hypothetical protein